MLTLDIQRDSALDSPSDEQLQRSVSTALAATEAGTADAEISLRLVDEDEMRELNGRYRDRDYATNVLSFPAELPAVVDLPLLGDIVICAPVVQREATEQGKAQDAHWDHMLVHGVLHLLGYDHLEDGEAELMESLERRILASLGHADPYEPACATPSTAPKSAAGAAA
ncbi:MAG: rRNA maturation RNase YbeY [Pseudomonadota bacterium]